MAKHPGFEDVVAEVSGAELGDVRRTERLKLLAERIAARPAASFPQLSRGTAELEGAYRFFGSEHVSPESILEPHLRATAGRIALEDVALVAHDTTYFSFEGDREGMGRIHAKDQGFWAHCAFAIGTDRRALGVIGLKYGTRLGASRWKGSRRQVEVGQDDPSEHLRWPELVTEVATRLAGRSVIHVMDREADWFVLFKHMVELEQRFVVRLTHDRLVEEGHVSDLWAQANVTVEREVGLSARAEGDSARQRKRHPARRPRIARLQIQGARTKLRSSGSNGELDLSFVHVVELNPPENCSPVVWNLLTTESVETEEQLLRVVDAYRARWVIEEFFKVLKTGCAFEKRQLCSYHALLNALAVLLPVAWSLLRLRDTGRRSPDALGVTVLRPTLLRILRQLARTPLPEEPTARDVMYAIAGLGGHLKRNGDPGWITLGRGFESLLEAEEVLRRCDQS